MDEDKLTSGPLVVGKAVFEPRGIFVTRGFGSYSDSDAFSGFPYRQPCPVPKQRIDVEEIARDYDTRIVHVDKRTQRIRYENETESEVTIVIEPK